MKYLVISLVMCSSLSTAKANVTPEQKDFFVICESAKFAAALRKSAHFDAAERAVLVAKMQDALVSSEAAKNTLKAVAMVSPAEKVKLLKKGAQEVGIKTWNCASANEFSK